MQLKEEQIFWPALFVGVEYREPYLLRQTYGTSPKQEDSACW